MVDHSVSALLNTFRTKQPIVLIADDKYAEFPFDLAASGKEGHAYIVLGQYMIRDFWAEQQPADNSTGTAVRYRFAFQWCGREEPWWHLPPENAIQGKQSLDCWSSTQTFRYRPQADFSRFVRDWHYTLTWVDLQHLSSPASFLVVTVLYLWARIPIHLQARVDVSSSCVYELFYSFHWSCDNRQAGIR